MAEEDEGAPAAPPVADTQRAEAPGSHVSPNARRSTPTRRPTTSATSPTVRVSPYPLRERTPPQHLTPPAASSRQRPRVSLDASPEGVDQHRLQLIVQGIVKNTVGQRDTSGRVLEIFAANGATFSDIVHKLWKKFSCHVKGVAVKQDDTWTVESPVESAWSRAMQFKSNGRIVTASSILLPTFVHQQVCRESGVGGVEPRLSLVAAQSSETPDVEVQRDELVV
ncbi:hypothetical protein KRP22_014914 [Phytophthora ramorum]|nr:hypothetical protein KRP22_14031 [Phytophthora ramorum]